MKPERWQQLDKLFHSALERAPAERSAFLDESCAGDESLRRQVEALLAAHEEAGSFIERSAMEVEARGLAAAEGTTEAELVTGESISHYRIIAPLGAGGMGQVYLAQDMALGRKVALKLLPADFTRDEDRVRRFGQEARAASALNHPNIVTIYGIEQDGSAHFITTEFIDGLTLRQRLSDGPLKLTETLDIGLQVASALAAAHTKGIIHRDIKPENIMLVKESSLLRGGHYIKVLDFGIAKLSEPRNTDTEVPTRLMVHTGQGMAIGTAPYMSPEQARGEEVDVRTDIWSLGVVLYEMMVGKMPFVGETPQEISASILKDEPLPLSQEIPEGLKWVVKKALRKDREDRYQTIREMFSDLHDLQQELVEQLGRKASVPSESSRWRIASNSQARTDPAAEPAAFTGHTAARSTSSAEYLVSEIKRHKLIAALVIILIAIASIAIRLYKTIGHHQPAAPYLAIKITRLTNTGNVTGAAISPDSKYVAYVIDDAGQQSLWVRHISTSSNVQIVPPAEATYYGLVFSPDGGYVYYNKKDNNGLLGVLHQVPVLGGNSRRVLEDVDGLIAFSPDGKQIAFVRWALEGKSYLMVANSDGSELRTLATCKFPARFNLKPAWSPDGGVIFCPVRNRDASGNYANVVKVRVADGMEDQFTSQRWQRVFGVAWLRDGGGLLVNANGQIWYLSYPEGEAREVTNDLNNYQGVSVSADSSVMVTTQANSLSSIWVTASDGANRSGKEVTTRAGNDAPVWTAEGKIIYDSNANGNWDLWVMDADGGNRKQLTLNAGQNYYPSLSADGQYVIFVSDRTGTFHVWRVDKDGSNPKQLTNGGGEFYPDCSPDGRFVMYLSPDNPIKPTLWRIPLDGGTPVQLTDKVSGAPKISPDGKLVACMYFEEEDNPSARLALIPSEGGKPVKLFDIQPTAVLTNELELGVIRWTTDGKAMTYVDSREAVSNIWRQSLDGGKPVQLTDFKSDRIFSFNWSHDGKQLTLARGTVTSDAVLISDLR